MQKHKDGTAEEYTHLHKCSIRYFIHSRDVWLYLIGDRDSLAFFNRQLIVSRLSSELV